MRLPRFRPRLTIRGLMIAVAIAMLLLGYAKHWIRYRMLASNCQDRAIRLGTGFKIKPDGAGTYQGTDTFSRLMRKADEYNRAARYPWLSVEPE